MQFPFPFVCVYYTFYAFIFYASLHGHSKMMRYCFFSDYIICFTVFLLLTLVCTNVYLFSREKKAVTKSKLREKVCWKSFLHLLPTKDWNPYFKLHLVTCNLMFSLIFDFHTLTKWANFQILAYMWCLQLS